MEEMPSCVEFEFVLSKLTIAVMPSHSSENNLFALIFLTAFLFFLFLPKKCPDQS